jgi:hypothetical protein
MRPARPVAEELDWHLKELRLPVVKGGPKVSHQGGVKGDHFG